MEILVILVAGLITFHVTRLSVALGQILYWHFKGYSLDDMENVKRLPNTGISAITALIVMTICLALK